MKNRDERLDSDREFIFSKKHDYNINNLLRDYPEGVPDPIICRVLQISEKKLKMIYSRAIISMRKKLS